MVDSEFSQRHEALAQRFQYLIGDQEPLILQAAAISPAISPGHPFS
jgi:hypothetical protein